MRGEIGVRRVAVEVDDGADDIMKEILEEERAMAEFNERASAVIVTEGRGGKGKSVLELAREGEEQERRELMASGVGRFGVRGMPGSPARLSGR